MSDNPDPLGLGALRRHARLTAAADRLPSALDRIVRPRRWRRNRLVRETLADPVLVARFVGDERLPAGHGVGIDERAVEYPWLLAHRPFGRLLDAGSVLNRPDVLDRFQPEADELTIVTLAPERHSYPERGISYVYADLRDLPFADGSFDTVICGSTLEHVGMDNTQYADGAVREAEPELQVERAARELRRVLVPGGRLLVTVPYGERQDIGWLLQLDRTALERLLEVLGPGEAEMTVFRYTRGGWQRGSLDGDAGARYRDPVAEPRPDDLAASARAVACIAFTSS